MATVVEEVVRDGRIVLRYDNGLERWKDTGRIIKSGESQRITKANSHELQRKRQEKARQALRARILEATQAKSTLPLNTAAEAVAEAGGMLWNEIVLADPLTPGVYPRDRMEAWEKLGKYSGVLSDPKQQPAEQPIQTPQGNTIVLLVAELAKRRQDGDIIDADPVDNDCDNS